MSYSVALDAFHGPLDLLLYLVRRNEIDPYDIPISLLADQFLQFLSELSEVDVELAGDFIVTAATLMEIKARSLLPSEATEDSKEEADPRRELVKQLLEYRRVKDATAILEQKAEERANRISRIAVPEPHDPQAPIIRTVELWDLVSAFARIVRETQALRPTTIAVDDTPQHVYEQSILARVRAAGRLPFRDLFEPPYYKTRLIGLFLAVLELIRGKLLWIEQVDAFTEIWLITPDGEGD
jgi:segregation and condensation protein A